ncbi:MAG: hypothetical protein U9Q34_01545 [Elusimicrobiota bacterium]|nr:hypothetical protein [Elusimicrobiota bacterium]
MVKIMKAVFKKVLRKVSLLSPLPSPLRRGQTAIEYILIMLALFFVFSMMYRSLQWYLSKEFRAGGIIVLRMYKEDPW